MINYIELLTKAREALDRQFDLKPRGARLRDRHYWVRAIAYEVMAAIQFDVGSEAEQTERAERSLKGMKSLSAALDRDNYVAGARLIRARRAERTYRGEPLV